jgi:YD repeat-containing protein
MLGAKRLLCGLVPLLAVAVSLPEAAHGQTCTTLDPPCADNSPSVVISPSGGTYTSASRSVTIDWADDYKLDFSTRKITFNGTVITSSFSHSGSTTSAQSSGTVTLVAGSNTLSAEICDEPSPGGGPLATAKCTTHTATYTYDPPPPPQAYATPTVSLGAMSMRYHSTALCVVDCFESTVVHATPGYVSLDQERSVTLMYRSGHAVPRILIEADAMDNSTNVPATMTLRIRKPNGSLVTLHNGTTAVVYQAGTGTTRLSAQFTPSAPENVTGSYVYQAIVTTAWANGTNEESQPVDVRFTVLDERSSPFGAGWTMPGLQRLHIQPDGILVTEGDGSWSFFLKSGSSWTAPQEETTTLTFNSSTNRYTRTYPDRTIAVFNGTSGLLLYLEDRFGNRTSYAYSSGRLISITDPVGRVTALAYSSGKLVSITDPTSRVTSFAVNGSGQLATVTDPDGELALSATYSTAANSLHRLNQVTDRRGGTTNFAYDSFQKLQTLTLPTVVVNTTSQRPTVQLISWERAVLAATGTSASPGQRIIPDAPRAAVTTPRGHRTDFKLNHYRAPTRVEEPLQHLTTIGWNDRAQPTTTVSRPGTASTIRGTRAAPSPPSMIGRRRPSPRSSTTPPSISPA